MDALSRSLGRFTGARCAGPEPFRPMRKRAHRAGRGFAKDTVAGWDHVPAGAATTRTSRVLVVGLDPETGSMLRFCLQHEGYEVVEAPSDTEAVHRVLQFKPTAILIDLDTTQAEGVLLMQQLREHTRAHIIVLSHAGDESLKLRALDGGANDFVQRPFSMAELAARLRAAVRFAACSPSPSPIFRSGELSVDLSSQTVKLGERSVSLTATEFSVLSFLIRNAGKVLTHAQILREVWGPKMLNRLEYLRVYLKSLRRKLELNPEVPQLILTIRSVGYRLAIIEN